MVRQSCMGSKRVLRRGMFADRRDRLTISYRVGVTTPLVQDSFDLLQNEMWLN